MFGSEMLDIAIGLVLVFLLVSLILTAAQEALEGLLKSRGGTLQAALLELFQHDSALLKRFYEHPLVFALYRQAYPGLPVEGANTRNLPSYIPRETFSAVMTQLRSSGELAANPRMDEAVAACEAMCDGSIRRTRAELESWYDGVMDRASGHYKRRTQKYLFFMGLAAAILLNINAVVIGQYLAVSTTARDQIVRLAEATAQGPAPAAETPSTPTVVETPKPGETPPAGASIATDPIIQAPAQPIVPKPEPVAADATVKDGPLDTNKLYSDLSGLQMPIGWSHEARAHIRNMVAPGKSDLSPNPLFSLGAWLTFLVGYLITALAAMLGAPFWFDVLNRLMVIRATVKPKEKSPDEPSQDGGKKKPDAAGGAEAGHQSVKPDLDDGAVG